MNARRFDIADIVRWLLRSISGGDWPFLLVERRYLAARVPPGAVVVDVGGGDGRLANQLVDQARRVFIVDRESTALPGADSGQYAGSLSRAVLARASDKIAAVRGDATALPFTDGSIDVIVSSQLLEHITDAGKQRFFSECARVLKPSGVVAVSTPNGDYIATHRFWVPSIARKTISPAWIGRLPALMRGPWLELGVDGWERRVGHYDHGCRVQQLRSWSRREGFEEVDVRFLHTWLTSFWFQLLCTFPLLFVAALPLVRFLYLLETKVPASDGVNLMVTYRKAS
jgi:ubiquinone/menaquinone biosynthesis C-methylase UbiE